LTSLRALTVAETNRNASLCMADIDWLPTLPKLHKLELALFDLENLNPLGRLPGLRELKLTK
jgi:hypothetical protein